MNIPRVAFFADSFHEVNGVARTSREFTRFAKERCYPFFSVCTGPQNRHSFEGTLEKYEIRSSRASLPLQADLSFDLLFFRHLDRLLDALGRFRPDLIHITGPSHCGCLGAMAAKALKVPLVASWHTNLHEYAARRLHSLIHWLPKRIEEGALACTENASLSILLRFYRLARILFAPNPELINLLATKTERPTFAMHRGIDTELFSPERRQRADLAFVIGYVGRLSPEKNVRLLAELEEKLIQQGVSDYRFLIIGEGSERTWMSQNMKRCSTPGVLLGTELAEAYASMDAFIFPSTTDTFGNVVLESMASGVPTLVSSDGGPKYLVKHGTTGFIARDVVEFARYVLVLRGNPQLRSEMSQNARRLAYTFSWNAVFDNVYETYNRAIAAGLLGRPLRSANRPLLSSTL